MHPYAYPTSLPAVDTPVVIQLAEELKAAPFNMTAHGAYGVARHAVAQMLSPAAAGWPATPGDATEVRDCATVDASPRLIGELRAEVAALKAAAALTLSQKLRRACISMMSASKRLNSSENNENLAGILAREARFLSSDLAPSDDHMRETVRDAVASALASTYYCSRTWAAWQVGTMTQQDFSPAGDVSEVVDGITDAAIAAIQT